MKKILKILGAVTLVLLVLSLIFTAATYIFHSIKTNQELELLREEGYYNPVSVGDYSLNVAKFGNENGKHTIVGLAGLGMGDYAVTARQMTAPLLNGDRAPRGTNELKAFHHTTSSSLERQLESRHRKAAYLYCISIRSSSPAEIHPSALLRCAESAQHSCMISPCSKKGGCCPNKKMHEKGR